MSSKQIVHLSVAFFKIGCVSLRKLATRHIISGRYKCHQNTAQLEYLLSPQQQLSMQMKVPNVLFWNVNTISIWDKIR